MCMALYVAAERPLRTIPEVNPPAAIAVCSLDDRAEPVRRHFSKSHVYFIGAHTGCSCGFSFESDDDDAASGRASGRALRAFLDEAIAEAGEVELYACWDGEEGEAPGQRISLNLAEFAGDEERFDLVERRFIVLVR